MNDKQKRDEAVDDFATAIKARLDEQAAKGYTGWDGEYSADELRSEIREDAEDMEWNGETDKAVDIGARAMMLYFRSHNPPPRPATQEVTECISLSGESHCQACGIEWKDHPRYCAGSESPPRPATQGKESNDER